MPYRRKTTSSCFLNNTTLFAVVNVRVSHIFFARNFVTFIGVKGFENFSTSLNTLIVSYSNLRYYFILEENIFSKPGVGIHLAVRRHKHVSSCLAAQCLRTSDAISVPIRSQLKYRGRDNWKVQKLDSLYYFEYTSLAITWISRPYTIYYHHW